MSWAPGEVRHEFTSLGPQARRRRHRLALAPVAAPEAPGDPGRPRYDEGASGVGDPYFPLAGNGGIDVRHYGLDLDHTPPAAGASELVGQLVGQLEGTATVRLTATEDLESFNLDLRDLQVGAVTVEGKRARFSQDGGELRIVPRPKLKAGRTVDVGIDYGGCTGRPTDVEGALYGFVTTSDGAMVVSETDGSSTWFPVNDHPSDKAAYTFEITVPEGLVAVANGSLAGQDTMDGKTTWSWNAPAPMAAYLATATVGNFELRTRAAPDGTPIIDAIDANLAPLAAADLALTGEMMVFFEQRYGDYPFATYGAIVDGDPVGYALETQTRSFFSRRAGEGTIAHELGHQWMGNHVSPALWADIWLNESWATYSTWQWDEGQGRRSAQEAYEEVLARPADDPYWDLVIADPGATSLFADPVYTRGATTLHALRVEIGDDAFYDLARTWVQRYGGGSADTEDFVALSEEVSGQDLSTLFDAWVYTSGRPESW